MLKKFVISFLLIMLSACSSNSKTINIEEKAEKIIEELSLKDEMIKVENNDIERTLYLEDNSIEDGILYLSSSNKADIIGILKSNNAEDVKVQISEYIETLTTSNGNYFPEEVEKLKNAIISVKGDYVFVIVSNNQNAIKKFINLDK